MSMSGRIVIVSDLHLGRRRHAAKSAESLRSLWDGADRLIVNGDVAEVHHPQHWSDAARETLHLFDLCETDGVELTLISGNHDPFITDRRHLLLGDGEIFITHGDVMHPAVAPWSPAAGRIRRVHDRALNSLEPGAREELESRLMVSQHACYAEWSNLSRLEEEAAQSSLRGMLVRPWALAKVLIYWSQFPGLAAQFLSRHAPRARFAILGHTHHAGTWEVDGRWIINTGSFGFPGRPRGVIIEDHMLSVVPIEHRRRRYEFARSAIRRFDLPGCNASRLDESQSHSKTA
jgi:predicted phosphodiesterase